MTKKGGEPAMINAPDVYTTGGNGVGAIKALTINPMTGLLYGLDGSVPNNGRGQLFLLDSSRVSTPSAPTNALVGKTAAADNTSFTGAVRGNNKNNAGPGGGAGGITFNAGSENGALVIWNGQFGWDEWVVQDASVGWGVTVETPYSNAATYASGNLPYGCCGHSVREALGYLDHTSVSGTEKYRYVWYHTQYGGQELKIAHSSTNFTASPTDTTKGTRSAGDRPVSVNLMTVGQITNLVPTGTMDGLAVRGEVSPDVFDLYMLFRDQKGAGEADDETYLAAVRATIPSGGTAMSYEVIDLDPSSANNWMRVMDTVAAKDVVGTGIAFSGDGNKMYVAGYLNYSTGHPTYDTGRTYIFEPPPPKGALVMVR